MCGEMNYGKSVDLYLVDWLDAKDKTLSEK